MRILKILLLTAFCLTAATCVHAQTTTVIQPCVDSVKGLTYDCPGNVQTTVTVTHQVTVKASGTTTSYDASPAERYKEKTVINQHSIDFGVMGRRPWIRYGAQIGSVTTKVEATPGFLGVRPSFDNYDYDYRGTFRGPTRSYRIYRLKRR